MTVKNDVTIKVFISYSWTNNTIIDWVRDELATRLLGDGIDVKLDQWDLKDGNDTFAFMESMVNDESIDKVLIICDKGYQEKANMRKGGVGTETQIITPEVYGNVTQEKFIPVVFERDEGGKDFIPTYMKSIKYIDLSSPELFIQNYEQLLRTLYKRPQHRKPSIGKPPTYLFEEEINTYEFQLLLNQIKLDLEKGRNDNATIKLKTFKSKYIDLFVDEMFLVSDGNTHENTMQSIENKIDDMLPLRDGFVYLVEISVASNILDPDFIIEFFEDLYNSYIDIKTSFKGNQYESQFDHYKFLIREIWLYTILLLLKHEQYVLVSDLIYGRYYLHDFSAHNPKKGYGFEKFDSYLASLDEFQVKKSGKNYISYAAEKIKRRSTLKKYTMKNLANVDLLLYYISCFKGENQERQWFPRTYIYRDGYSNIELLQKLESSRFFEKVKVLFNVETKDELIGLLKEFENVYSDGYGNFKSIPDIKTHIELQAVCKYR